MGTAELKKWSLTLHQGVALVSFAQGTLITPEMLIDTYDALNADPQKYRTTNAVYDLRNIVPDQTFGFERMLRVAGYVQANREPWWKHEKTALVVSTSVTYGLSRMYSALMDGKTGHQVKVFEEDLEAAIKWAQAPD